MGIRPWPNRGFHVHGRDAQQGAEPVLGLPQHDLVLRDGGLGLRDHALLLVDVQLADDAELQAGLGDDQDLTLELDVLPGQRDPLLGLAHHDVVRRHVAQQGHEHGVVVLHRAFHLGPGGQDLAAVESPEVQLPGQVEPQVPVVERRGKTGDVDGKRGRRHLLAGIAARDVLRLGEDVAPGDGQRVAGLEDARAVFLEVDVLVVGVGDEIVERGVVEDAPPPAQVGGMALHAAVAAVDPLRRNFGPRPAVLGPHLEAMVNVVRKTGTPPQAERRRGNT